MFFSENMPFNPLWIAMISFALFFVIQLCYFLFLYRRIVVLNSKDAAGARDGVDTCEPVSVVVYACNDAENLSQYLPQILNQDYPTYEVIVVNDGSTDETKDLLTDLAAQYPHLYQTYIPEGAKNHSRRKLAMAVGIKAAKYDWILSTEANCEVAGNQWIRRVARNFTPQTEVVLLYASYVFPKAFGSTLRALDNLLFSVRYLSMADAGKPFMGVRRNLAYRKELFFKNKGYSGHLNLRDGDDDLFINQVANQKNTRVEVSRESVTRANYYLFDKAWSEQKRAHGITSNYFRSSSSLLLGFDTFSRYLFYLSIAAVVCLSIDQPLWWGVVSAGFVIRLVVQAVVVNKIARGWGERGFYLSLFYYDLLQPVVDAFYRISGRMSKRK